MNAFETYGVVTCAVSALGLVYLLWAEWVDAGYQWSFVAATVGLFAFAVVEPLSDWYLSTYAHAVHAVMLLPIVGGLAALVAGHLETGDWADALVTDPVHVHGSPEWMKPLDHRVISLFHSTDIVLTPAIVAYNLEYSREEVNRRLSELTEHGYVERVERGKYRLTADGERYLRTGAP